MKEIKFKIGDRVKPNADTLKHWGEDLTKDKIYIVKGYGGIWGNNTRVFDDVGECYWSSPEDKFYLVPNKNVIGGKIL